MLTPVTGLKQVSQSGETTTFTWNPGDPNADGFDVLVDNIPSGSVTVDAADVTTDPGTHVLGVVPFANPTPPTTLAFSVPVPQVAPATPTGLNAPPGEITDTTALVTANTVPGADEYGLAVDGVWLTPQATPVWNLNGLAPGVVHVLLVDASNAAGTSAPSAPVAFTTLPTPTEPATPVGLAVPASTITQTSAVVSCFATPGALTYGLELDGVLLPQQVDPTWALTGLEPDSEHTVSVDASNDVGTSDPSTPVTFTTANPVSPPPPASGVNPTLVLVGAAGVLAAIGIAIGHGGKHLPRR